MRTYLYKVMHDAGTAPCVDDGILTLAICKPAIRRTAQPGDWIYGFAAQSRLGKRLIYVARVDEALPAGEYYRQARYWKRSDSIYRWRAGRLVQISNDVHGKDNCIKDIGTPPNYAGARVLVCREFRYFGSADSAQFTSPFPDLMRYVSKVGQGHRVNLPGRVHGELDSLSSAIWAAHPRTKILGKPSDARPKGRGRCKPSRLLQTRKAC